jgi:hypothetical protein
MLAAAASIVAFLLPFSAALRTKRRVARCDSAQIDGDLGGGHRAVRLIRVRAAAWIGWLWGDGRAALAVAMPRLAARAPFRTARRLSATRALRQGAPARPRATDFADVAVPVSRLQRVVRDPSSTSRSWRLAFLMARSRDVPLRLLRSWCSAATALPHLGLRRRTASITH